MSKTFNLLKKLYLKLKPIPVVGWVAGFFVSPVERWIGPKANRRKISRLDSVVNNEISVSLHGLLAKLEAQNEKITALEDRLSLLECENKFMLIHSESFKRINH